MCNEMELHRGSSRALPVDSYPRRIPAERSNMSLDPFKSLCLVKKANIEVSIDSVREFWDSEEPEGRKTVIDGDDDDIGALMDPIVEWKGGGVAVNVASSMDIDKYGY